MTPIYPALVLLQGSTNTLLGPIFMYGAIFAIFYFILIRPGQKQRKAQEALVRQVKRGDEIVTFGGIVGEVIHIRENPAEDGKNNANEDLIVVDSSLSMTLGRMWKLGAVSPIARF